MRTCDRCGTHLKETVMVCGQELCGSCIETELREARKAMAKLPEWHRAIARYTELAGPLCLEHDSEGDDNCEECQITSAVEAALAALAAQAKGEEERS